MSDVMLQDATNVQKVIPGTAPPGTIEALHAPAVSTARPLLSVVIICKNEERFIEKCIQSVMSALSPLGDYKLALVDSASRDRTIELAARYPISIYQLREQHRHTPAAGRYIGFMRTRGEYVFFLDGDSFLVKGFVEQALDCFQKNRRVAAIIGRRREIYYDYTDDKVLGEERDINRIGDVPKGLSVATASAIYRRDVLDGVGCFNPYLFSEEEAELSDRITRGGYRIMGVPADMVVHNTLPREKVKTLFARMKSNFHLGPGQIFRYRLGTGISGELFRRINPGLHFLAWCALGAASLLISLLLRAPVVFLGWMSLGLLLFLAFVLKSRSMKKPVAYTLLWAVLAYSLIKGFLITPLEPETYPIDVVVIKERV